MFIEQPILKSKKEERLRDASKLSKASEKQMKGVNSSAGYQSLGMQQTSINSSRAGNRSHNKKSAEHAILP